MDWGDADEDELVRATVAAKIDEIARVRTDDPSQWRPRMPVSARTFMDEWEGSDPERLPRPQLFGNETTRTGTRTHFLTDSGIKSAEVTARDDDEDPECTFTPKINNWPEVRSTMHDYMRSWQERRLSRLRRLQVDRHHEEQSELWVRPQQRTKSATEALLRDASYQHPVQDWRHHADKYHQARVEEKQQHPPQRQVENRIQPYAVRSPVDHGGGGSCGSTCPPAGGAPSPPAWMATVERLYPGSQGKSARSAQATPVGRQQRSAACASRSPKQVAAHGSRSRAASGSTSPCGSVSPHGSRTGFSDPSGVAAYAAFFDGTPASAVIDLIAYTDPTQACGNAPASEAAPAPGMPGRRRLGRPPKATWEYLSDLGARQLRERATPQPFQAELPKPLPRSEELLRAAEENGQPVRKPLIPSAPTPTAPSVRLEHLAPESEEVSRYGYRLVDKASAADEALVEMFERAEKRRMVNEQRASVAAELRVAEEMRECTFHPQTNSNSQKLVSQQAGERTCISLYNRGLQALKKRQEVFEEAQQLQAEKEMSQCTFHPVINFPAPELLPSPTTSPEASSSTANARPEVTYAKQWELANASRQPSQSLDVDVSEEANPSVHNAVFAMLEQWRGATGARRTVGQCSTAPSASGCTSTGCTGAGGSDVAVGYPAPVAGCSVASDNNTAAWRLAPRGRDLWSTSTVAQTLSFRSESCAAETCAAQGALQATSEAKVTAMLEKWRTELQVKSC